MLPNISNRIVLFEGLQASPDFLSDTIRIKKKKTPKHWSDDSHKGINTVYEVSVRTSQKADGTAIMNADSECCTYEYSPFIVTSYKTRE